MANGELLEYLNAHGSTAELAAPPSVLLAARVRRSATEENVR